MLWCVTEFLKNVRLPSSQYFSALGIMQNRYMIRCYKMGMNCPMRKLVSYPEKTTSVLPKGNRGIFTSSLFCTDHILKLPAKGGSRSSDIHNGVAASLINDGETSSAVSLSQPETDGSSILSNVECNPTLQGTLSRTCHVTYKSNCLSDEDVERRTLFFENMLSHLRKKCHPKINLELFGSSSNGFGIPTSDIDLCISFEGHVTSENVSTSVLTGVKSALWKFDKCANVRLIKSAQVPIVTFDVLGEKFQCGDISLYNRLAVRNSSLLYAYASLDKRCKILGLTFKHLMKTCGMTNRVSSYALIVMVIHFLQQCVPPVLPVLQELYTSADQASCIVGGWDSWFYDDIGNIESVWLGYGMNNASIGNLWFKLLQYYSEYSFEKHVITIRQHKTLNLNKKIHSLNKIAKEYNHARTRKLRWNHWVKRTIMIEDPFDQVHNLMGGISPSSADMLIETIKESYRELLKANDAYN